MKYVLCAGCWVAGLSVLWTAPILGLMLFMASAYFAGVIVDDEFTSSADRPTNMPLDATKEDEQSNAR